MIARLDAFFERSMLAPGAPKAREEDVQEQMRELTMLMTAAEEAWDNARALTEHELHGGAEVVYRCMHVSCVYTRCRGG